MRYYDLTITPPKATVPTLHFTSYPNGVYDPGALNVIFDVQVAPEAVSPGGAIVTVEGIDPKFLTNARNYAGANLVLKGGMGKGLPLAKPQQAGLLLQGQILQAYGNWRGTQIDANFVFYPPRYTLDNPGPFVLNWKAGTPLAGALMNTLRVAYPNTQINMQIGNYVQAHDEVHPCRTLMNLARLIRDVTGDKVNIWHYGDAIMVSDNSKDVKPKALDFDDMIGQPMWLKATVIQVMFAMRADIWPTNIISFPQATSALPGFVQTARAAIPSAANYQSAIQGELVVTKVRHVGNLRAPSGTEWCTVIEASPRRPAR